MESKQVQMYHISKPEESNNKENVVLRALVADPNRHRPLVEHSAPSTNVSEQSLPKTSPDSKPIPTAMYTLESRYRPIPEKVLPKSTDPKLYYIENKASEQPPVSVAKETREPSPTVALEPEIISQPILYSIVGAKDAPVLSEQPIPVDEETPLPILYTITGQVHHPNLDMSTNVVDVATPVIDTSPMFYSLLGNPNHHVQVEEPIEQVQQTTQQSVPSFYSIVGSPHAQSPIQEPLTKLLPLSEQSMPNFYAIVGNPQAQPQLSQPIKEVRLLPQESTPTLYSVVGGPHVQPSVPEPISEVQPRLQPSIPSLYSIVGGPQIRTPIEGPIKQTVSQPQHSSPSLYSIVGGPTRILPTTEVNIVNPSSSVQPVRINPTPALPTLHAIVGKPQVPINIPKENQQAVSPVRKQPNDGAFYTLVGGPNISQTMTLPPKIQPLQSQKQPQIEVPTPMWYPLIGKHNTPSRENMDSESSSPVRRRIPPPKLMYTRRYSRSYERQSAPEAETRELAPVIPPKRKRFTKSKEHIIPKSETVFIPFSEEERPPRHPHPRSRPRRNSPGQLQRKPFTIANYGPIQLPDYVSPYAYYPSKPYHERTLHPGSLPILTKSNSDRSPRPPLYEPRRQGDRKHPSEVWMPHSQERYPVKPKHQPRVWDYDDKSESESDDDENDTDEYRKRRQYLKVRRRLPWVPVW